VTECDGDHFAVREAAAIDRKRPKYRIKCDSNRRHGRRKIADISTIQGHGFISLAAWSRSNFIAMSLTQ
jgi:hypothetical protein